MSELSPRSGERTKIELVYHSNVGDWESCGEEKGESGLDERVGEELGKGEEGDGGHQINLRIQLQIWVEL